MPLFDLHSLPTDPLEVGSNIRFTCKSGERADGTVIEVLDGFHIIVGDTDKGSDLPCCQAHINVTDPWRLLSTQDEVSLASFGRLA